VSRAAGSTSSTTRWYSVGRERLTQDERFMAGVLAGGLDARS